MNPLIWFVEAVVGAFIVVYLVLATGSVLVASSAPPHRIGTFGQ
jgi:hypothetical protein